VNQLTREDILQALQQLREPRLGRSLTELNWIRDVMVRETSVALTVVLSEEREEWKSELESRIKDILAEAGKREVRVRFRAATEYELGKAGVEVKREAPDAQAGKRHLLDPASGVEFIAVASGKGGVGKSTVSVNLAVALARLGKRVGIVDADIYGFSVPDMMGIEDRPRVVDGAIHPVERFGVKVISMGFFIEDNSPVIWRGPMLGKMLRNFFNEVHWGELDYLVLDLPPGTGDVALDVHQLIPHSKELLVTTPHATAAFVAARAGAMARQTNHEILGVVENMAYYQCSSCGKKDYIYGRGGGAKLAEELGTRLLAQIPLGDPQNHPSEPDFSPSVYKKDSEIGAIYLDLASNITALVGK
jgi:ATP-binding protein involved in chromosome partitioning